jgi:hypothetical protein
MASRRYSIFTVEQLRNGRKHYHRASSMAFPKPVAIRVFQDMLLGGAYNGRIMELRPVTPAQPVTNPLSIPQQEASHA